MTSPPTPEDIERVCGLLSARDMPTKHKVSLRRFINAYEALKARIVVLSYATWSEEYYAASWFTHSPETVKAAREWWAQEQQRPLTEYEQAVVNEWRSQEAHHD